jgi:hypothetical protein
VTEIGVYRGVSVAIWAYIVLLRKQGVSHYYRGADKSLAQPTSRCILFDGENISFDASLLLYK